MALKDIWKDIVDGVDEIKGEYTNQIAHSLISAEDAFESHVKGEEYNHSAKDITYTGAYYDEEPNVEDAINTLGKDQERLNGLIAGNFRAIEKNTTDITAIKTDVEAHTTTINNIIDDLANRPTSEWAEAVEINLSDKETRVSALEETVGDVETALDSIIAIQNELIGGDSV